VEVSEPEQSEVVPVADDWCEGEIEGEEEVLVSREGGRWGQGGCTAVSIRCDCSCFCGCWCDCGGGDGK